MCSDPILKMVTDTDWDIYSNNLNINYLMSSSFNLTRYNSFRTHSILGRKNLRDTIALKYLADKARLISYENNGLFKIIESVNNIMPTKDAEGMYPKEQGGYIFFVPNRITPKVIFYALESEGDSKTFKPKKPYYNPGGGAILIAKIHTHPEEALQWKAFGNKTIFDAQYTKGDSDGNTRMPLYSVGYTEIDYYSPYGKTSSKNGLCSNTALLSGKFNLLKHALIEFANLYYTQ